MRTLGTQIRGIRTPIIQPGDDLVNIVVEALKNAWEAEGFQLQDRDVVAITESVVARAQNNFATITDLQKLDILTNKGLNWLNDFQFKDRRFGFGGLNNKLFIDNIHNLPRNKNYFFCFSLKVFDE